MSWCFEVHRDVAFGQWHSCLLVVHLGSTAYVFGNMDALPGDPYGRYYATVIAILTPSVWLHFRPGGRLDKTRPVWRLRWNRK